MVGQDKQVSFEEGNDAHDGHSSASDEDGKAVEVSHRPFTLSAFLFLPPLILTREPGDF